MLSEMIASWIGSMSVLFYIRQVTVILLLFLLGYIVSAAAFGKRRGIYEVLLSFPVGISVYTLAVFVLLVTGIRFNIPSAVTLCSAAAVFGIFILVRDSYFKSLNIKRVMAVIITVLCIAVISCSGLIPVSFSNDSLYYYHMYPRALVHNGGYRMQFNVFLTDVGQGSAILNTLPFLFGFDEGFGIQMFLNINTLLIAVYALYEQCAKYNDRRRAITAALMCAAALICSMPYLVMSVWVMSNGYFMCFMFICVYTVWREAQKDGSEDEKDHIRRMAVLGIMFTMLSLLRMEGCIAALILVLCFSVLKYSGKTIFMTFLLPILITSAAYDARIFLFMKIDAPYTFLTPLKALIQLAAIAAVSVYILFIRDKEVERIGRHMGKIIIVGLIAVNAALFMYNKTLFIENVKAFVRNISNQSGWGLFPMFVIGVYVMCIIAQYKKTGYNTTYWDLCFAAYLLTAVAVSFARDDALRESIADSGNRVMLQVTLLAFFAAADHIIQLINQQEDKDDGK